MVRTCGIDPDNANTHNNTATTHRMNAFLCTAGRIVILHQLMRQGVEDSARLRPLLLEAHAAESDGLLCRTGLLGTGLELEEALPRGERVGAAVELSQ